MNNGEPIISNVIVLQGEEIKFESIEHDLGICIGNTPDIKISINIEKDKKQTLILNYIIDNIETNINCLKYLPFS